jgi:NTE family protein
VPEESLIPDQLVLGSGGVLGDTWMSAVTAGLLDAGGPDLRLADCFVGTSAGSIVATRLAAGQDMREYIDRRFGVVWDPDSDQGGDPGAPLAGGAAGGSALNAVAAALLNGTRPAGALLRRAALRAVPEGREELTRLGGTIERLMPDWDPRLSLVGVDVRRGERLIMRADADLGLSVSEAVRASCAIPGVFRPVESARGPIVDGGIWSPVNLDAVPVPDGASVLCFYPSGYHGRPHSLKRTATTGFSRARVALEAATVRRRGSRVLVISPDAAAALAIGSDRMDPRRDEAAARAGYRQGVDLAGRLAKWLEGAMFQPECNRDRGSPRMKEQ